MSIELMGHPVPSQQRGAVLRYTGFIEIASGPVRMREHPCTYVPVIIDFGRGWRITHTGRGKESRQLGSFLAGLSDGPVEVEHAGSAACIQVDLTPLGARRLLGIPLSELTNRSVPLEDVLGRHAREPSERLAECTSWTNRFRLVEGMIDARLAEAPAPSVDLDWALARIVGRERDPIGRVARDLGWSHPRLIRRVRDATGLTPKQLQRIARVERLEGALRSDERADFARLAATLGFSDQPHLAREVRSLTGLTPSALQEHAVNFVQDGSLPEH